VVIIRLLSEGSVNAMNATLNKNRPMAVGGILLFPGDRAGNTFPIGGVLSEFIWV
jgi:hypothetical protein